MQCSAVKYSAVQCSAVQCCAVQYSAVQCSAEQCRAGQCSAGLFTVQCKQTCSIDCGYLFKKNLHAEGELTLNNIRETKNIFVTGFKHL